MSSPSASALFSPLTLRGLSVANRVVVSPMCQYSAVNGTASDWHKVHLPMLAMSGAGLVFVEATGVSREGRISTGCLALEDDDNERALGEVVALMRKTGPACIGIQLAHAGRKASCAVGWDGGKLLSRAEGGWTRVAPSAVSFFDTEPPPEALDAAGLERLRRAFATATERAARIGFDVVEMHAAHGYLLNQFLSPLSNQRTDAYGGSLENRMRFPLEVFAAMRAAWPADRPLGVRISATDWVEGGWTIEDSVIFARALTALGCDFIDCSSGGSSPNAKIAAKPGFQVPFAARIKKDAGIATIAVGLVTGAQQAEDIVKGGAADLVALARGFLWDPRWAWHAAAELGATVDVPPQVLRAAPMGVKSPLERMRR